MKPIDIWYTQNIPGVSLNAIAFGNGTFVAAGKNICTQGFLISADGVNWSARPFPKPYPNAPEFHVLDLAYGGGAFVAVTLTSTQADYFNLVPLVSLDQGVTWAVSPGHSFIFPMRIASRNQMFVVVGDAVAVSTDRGMTWQLAFENSASGEEYSLRDICVATNTSVTPHREFFVAVGSIKMNPLNQPCLFWLTSSDGLVWQERRLPAVGEFTSVTYGKGLLVATHSNGNIYTSSDALTWTGRQLLRRDNLIKILFANNEFVAIGDNGYVYNSPDGLNWRERHIGKAPSLSDICFGANRFVAINEIGEIFHSERVDQPFLNIQIENAGEVGIQPLGTSTQSEWGKAFDKNTSLTLSAKGRTIRWPLATAFSHWSGAVSGTNPDCKLTMDSDKEVTAHFVMKKPSLSIP